MPEDSVQIEPIVKLTDIVTFHTEADSALMHIQTSGEMLLRPIGTTPLGDHVAWIFTVCVLVCILIGMSRFLSDSYLSKLFSYVVIPTRSRGSVFTDLFMHYYPAMAVMSVVYILVLSLVVLEILVVFGYITAAPFEYYLYTLLGVLIYTGIKIILHVSILSCFGMSALRVNVVNHKILSSHVESLVMLPIAVIVPFLGVHNAELILITSIAVVFLLALWRLIRVFEDISTDLLSLVNIILYLCAVEVAPLLCMLKALSVI